MKSFLSCDWGTSTFRLRLINWEDQKILSEIKSGFGIASAFESWKQGGDEKTRLAFYQAYLDEQIQKLAQTFSHSVNNSSVVLSGMASSSIGMLELPYKELPFRCNGLDLIVQAMPEESGNRNRVIVISGVRSDDDVIRGEETMLAGCDVTDDDRQQLFIFPGTHSKHIIVKNSIAENFKTYMTGELFNLLSTKSILAASIKKHDEGYSGKDQQFIKGVIKGASTNIINTIFHVRTNQLFRKMTPGENYHYLSGLLIGHELSHLGDNEPAAITLVSGTELKKPYLMALDVLGLSKDVTYKDADDALINGQQNILKQKGYSNW